MHLQIRLGGRVFELDRAGDALTLDGEPLAASFEKLSPNSGLLVLDGRPHVVSFQREHATTKAGGEHIRITTGGVTQEVVAKDDTALLLDRFGFDDAGSAAEREVHAPMPGLVLHVFVEVGQGVAEGQGLVVLEAMKMENELRSPRSGKVAAIHVAPGDAVGKNDLLIELND